MTLEERTITAELIALFDADCGICQQTKAICQTMDTAGRVEFLALQKYVVFPDGSRYGGARAFFEVMTRMPGLVGVFGWLMAHRLPSAIAEPAYQWVAQNRGMISYRLGLSHCKTEKQ